MSINVLVENGAPRIVAGAFTATIEVNQAIQDPPDPETGLLPELRYELQDQEHQFPDGWIQSASADERAAIHAFVLDPPAPPEGQQVAGALSADKLAVDEAGVPSWNVTFEDIPPPPVPEEVSRMQARLALLAAGLLDDVDGYMAANADAETKEYWANAPTLHRDHPLVQQMTLLLDWTETQVDDLFRAAKLIS